jgi:hypothetical protein
VSRGRVGAEKVSSLSLARCPPPGARDTPNEPHWARSNIKLVNRRPGRGNLPSPGRFTVLWGLQFDRVSVAGIATTPPWPSFASHNEEGYSGG